MKKHKLLYILPITLFFACEPEFDDVDLNGGSADFSRVVAVGNSLSAGYQSNALSAQGQEYSLPNMVAGQLKQVGGGNFAQPIIPGESGLKGVGVSSQAPSGTVLPELVLKVVADCQNTLGPAPQLGGLPFAETEFKNNISADGPFNNVSAPGAKVVHLNFQGYGSSQGNPYFERFAANPLETMVEAAMKTNHTFFQLWIGNNDVLSYATGGGDEAATADPVNNSITPTALFTGAYKQTLDSLTKNGQKGVVANIPYVTDIPYFTTVPIGTDAVDATSAGFLNGVLYKAHNDSIDAAVVKGDLTQTEAARRKVNFTGGQINTFLVVDNSLKDLSAYNVANIRHAVPGELMILLTPGDSLRCAGWGTQKPIPGNFHITANELSKIKTAIDDFNGVIKSEADARGLAFVDANARMQELSTSGITVDGIGFTAAFISGGAFSLDGVHPSTRGYAILANDFIKAINAKYGANVPQVVVSSFPAVEAVQ